jgi:hypothetical protein
MNNTLILNKCAYIFDNTYGTYFFGTHEQRKKRDAIQKELKTYYDNIEKRNMPINYITEIVTHWNGETIEQFYIILNGEKHGLNAAQIKSIADKPDHIINNRRRRDFSGFVCDKFHSCNWSSYIYSNKFSSMEFEYFMGKDDLNYYRANFKGNHYTFIIDDRNGDIYCADGIQYAKINKKTIINHLDINSNAALKEFNLVIDYLVK